MDNKINSEYRRGGRKDAECKQCGKWECGFCAQNPLNRDNRDNREKEFMGNGVET
jgi:hypothetical protein